MTLGPPPQAEEERDDMERVKLDNKRILFNLLPAHVAQHFLMSNPRNMVSGGPGRGTLQLSAIYCSLPRAASDSRLRGA